MGLILFIIAFIGSVVLTAIWGPINIVWTLFTFRKETPGRILNRWFLFQAVLLDVYGCQSLAPLLNRTLIKGMGKYFFSGEERDTISYVLAVNQVLGTLTIFGRFWCRFLEKIDPGHLNQALIEKERRYTQWKNPIK